MCVCVCILASFRRNVSVRNYCEIVVVVSHLPVWGRDFQRISPRDTIISMANSEDKKFEDN